MCPISDYLNEYMIMAKTTATKKTAAAAKKAAPKNTAAKPTAIKPKGKAAPRKAAKPQARKPIVGKEPQFTLAEALTGMTIGGVAGAIATKLIFFR